ncbi:MAG: hypothetical protein K6A35_02865 [bacterium]|nr:hypothetical protein [bacterium]
MDEYEYTDEVEKEVDAIEAKALKIVQQTHPDIKFVYNRYSMYDCMDRFWDYPGKWYASFKLPNGVQNETELINIIVKGTIERLGKSRK